MSFENKSGLGVFNHYGSRDTGGSVGVETSDDSGHRLSISLTGASVNGTFLPKVVVPKGALFSKATLRVDEAFALSGTTPTVLFGSAGSVATNGIVLTKAELEAIGTKTPASTGVGTWAQASATGLAAAAAVAGGLGGTLPVVSPTVGKATLILEFTNKTKV